MPDHTSIDSDWLGRIRLTDEPAEMAQTLGDFELLREIGRGGMGVVFEARQVSLKRPVALKVLPPLGGLSPQAIQRFEREAHAAAKLHHTNIVPVYAIGEERGYHFYAMELVEGESLDQLLTQLKGGQTNPLLAETVDRTAGELQARSPGPTSQPVPTTSLSDSSAGGRAWFDTVARLTADIADALHYAHGRGVIHRDIKPANLLLSRDGRPMITDFGLARVEEETSLTMSGSFMGTPAYMSPEQIAGGRMGLDHRTDVYSLGVVLYELLTLHRAHPYEAREEIVAAIMTRDPRPPSRYNHRIPLDLETVCLKAMEKAPDRRYATAGELADDLRRFLGRGLILARRAGWTRRTAKSLRRHPVATTITAALIVLAAATVGFSWKTAELETREAVQRALGDARLQMNAGLYREALEQARRATALDPDSAAVRLLTARLLMKVGRAREAAEAAQRLLEANPDDWAAHLILASAADALPWISREEHIRVVQLHAPDSADACYLRSLVTDSSTDRLVLLDRALKLDPGHADALLERAALLTDELRDYPAALRDCELLIAIRPRSAQGHRMRARVHAARRDHVLALNELEEAIHLDPDDALNYEARAAIYSAAGQHDQAIADLGRALVLDPDHAPFHEHRAQAFNDAGRFESALADARQALELDPDRRSAYLPLFHAYSRLDREPELRAALDDLVRAADGWVDTAVRAWAYREIADQLRALKDYDRALAAAGRSIEAAPHEFRGYVYRARIHRERGHDVDFEADCGRAAEAEVAEASDLIDRGRGLMFDCSMWEQSLSDHDRVVERFPNWHVAYFQRGTAYSVMSRRNEALADLNRAIELAPNWAVAYVNRGIIYGELNRPADRLADYDRAIKLDPHLGPDLYSNRGYVRFELGFVEQALEDFSEAIRLDPLSIGGYTGRGAVLAFGGRCAEALDDLKRAEALRPTDAYVKSNIAWAQVNVLLYHCPQGYDPATALRYAKRAHDYFAEDFDQVLGHALYRNGHYDQARRSLLDTFRATDATGAWFVLAMCSWQMGRPSEARDYFDRSVAWMTQHNPRGPILLEQKREAAALLGLEP